MHCIIEYSLRTLISTPLGHCSDWVWPALPALTQFLSCTRTKTGSRLDSPARPADLSLRRTDNVSLALLAKCLPQNATQFTITDRIGQFKIHRKFSYQLPTFFWLTLTNEVCYVCWQGWARCLYQHWRAHGEMYTQYANTAKIDWKGVKFRNIFKIY